MYGRTAACQLLISAEADVNAKTLSGETPLELAIVTKQNDVVALLRSVGAAE